MRDTDGENKVYRSALPVYSVDTRKEADSIVVLACKMAGNGMYYLPGVTGSFEDLEYAEKRFAFAHGVIDGN